MFPRPAAIDVYARIWTLLTEAQLVAFVPLLVLKRKPYVGVLRPLIIPSVFFDQESRVLVLETLTDTDTTKDSASFRDYPRALPEISMAKVAQPIAAVQMNLRQLAPEWCVNPRRVRLKELVQAAVARSLK